MVLGLSWPEVHGALTHFPVAFLVVGFLFELGAVLFKKPEWRMVSFWCLVVSVVSAVPTLASGWITGNEIYRRNAPAVFVDHRTAAFVTSGISLAALLFRIKVRDRVAGSALAASLLLALLAASVAGYTGYLGGRLVFGGSVDQEVDKHHQSAGVPVKIPIVAASVLAAGDQVYQKNGCASCHALNGLGANTGPDLTHEAQRHADIAWQVAHLKNPSAMHSGSAMPSYSSLSSADLNNLGAYLATQK